MNKPLTTNLLPAQKDPTHTLTIRNKFVSEFRRRLRTIRGFITKSLVDNDALGLINTSGQGRESFRRFTGNMPAGRNQFVRPTQAGSIQAFREWFQEQLDEQVLQVTRNPLTGTVEQIRPQWTEKYIQQGYLSGVNQATESVRASGIITPSIAPTIDKLNLVQIQANPVHASAMETLFQRTFSELTGMTDTMKQQVARNLADGLLAGDGPRAIARNMNKTMQTLGKRAEVIARTETIRAHANASLNQMSVLGVTEVNVVVEFSTAGDNRVCPQCSYLEGRIFTIEKAQGIIPVHPQCRCTWIPANVGERRDPNVSDEGFGDRIPQSRIEEFGDVRISDVEREVTDIIGFTPPSRAIPNKTILHGKDGERGVSVAYSEINASGCLEIHYTDGLFQNVGKVQGSGIKDIQIQNERLLIHTTEGKVFDVGSVMGRAGKDGQDGKNGIDGRTGDKGEDGIGIKGTGLIDGMLFLELTNGNIHNLGKVIGDAGAKGDKGDAGKQGEQGEAGQDGINADIIESISHNDNTIIFNFESGRVIETELQLNEAKPEEFVERIELNNAKTMWRFRMFGEAWSEWIRIGGRGGGGGIGEAPKDGKTYGRNNGEWVEVSTGDGLETVNFTFARNSRNVTDQYLRGIDGQRSNLSSYVAPFNATIYKITVATADTESWTAEVRKNGSATVETSATMSGESLKVVTVNKDVDEGDLLQLYCNGININRPTVTIYLKRRN